MHKIKDYDGNLLDLKIDRVLHLDKLASRLISPQKLLRQLNSLSDCFHMKNYTSWLSFNGCKKTAACDHITSFLITCTESVVETLHNAVFFD